MSREASEPAEQLRFWIAGKLSGHSTGKFPLSLEHELPALAEAEGVAALLATALRHQDDPGVPRAVLDRLHTMELARAALELRRQQEVVRMLRALQQEGLAYLLLKGEALAHSLYPQSHLRTRSDIDLIFADRAGAECAWRVFEVEGYTRKPTLQGRFVGFQFACSRTLADGLEIQFDMHRKISDYTWFSRRLPFHELASGGSTVVIEDQEIACLDPAYALLHACLHRLGNKPHKTENRLIWLYDIHLLCNVMGERWPAFVALAGEKAMARVCLQGVAMAARYFGNSVDLSLLEDVAQREPIVLSEASTRWHLILLDWWYNPGLPGKLVQLREHLLPSVGYMQVKYGFNNRLLLPYYYLRRIALGVKKYGRR